MIHFAIGMCLGLLIGVVLMWLLFAARKRTDRKEVQQIEQHLREVFSSLAAAALDANSKQLTERAGSTLDSRKELIDQSLKAMNERLNELGKYFRSIEGERKSEFGRLSHSVSTLATTTGELHQMLASTQRRGAWGERMADDILRLAGLMEGVNYRKQSSSDAESGRPDFTFLLPNDLVVNMDVKFPLENYRAYLDAENDEQRAARLGQLIRDVKNHITAVSRRGYVDVRGGTVPYVLLFIPSEQIFSLVLAEEPDLVDDALGKQIVLSSPLTLYAMLVVIRQAAESANIMRTADEVLRLLGTFQKQWQKYCEEFDKLEGHIERVTRQYNTLKTTRSNMLQRPLEKIDDLRSEGKLPDPEGSAEE